MTTAATANGNGKSRLDKAQKTRLKEPLKILVYGPEGVGKSTLAAHAPDPIWADVEDGSGQLEITRYPFRDGVGGHVPQSYQEILAAIDDLANHDHPYKTLVVDTADRLESLIWSFMVARDAPSFKGKLTGIEGYGYGKGYNAAVDEWRAFCLRLDRLRTGKGMSIIMLAHAQIRTFKSPDTDDYDRYTLRLNEKAGGFLKEWADVTAYACFEETAASFGGDRAKGVSTGRRLLRFQRSAAFDAKTRLAMPAQVELDIADPWAPFARALNHASTMSTETLTAEIAAECVRIGDAETTAKVDVAVAAAVKKSDTAALHRYLVGLQNRPAKNANPNSSKEENANV
jgi:hypothetical protein